MYLCFITLLLTLGRLDSNNIIAQDASVATLVDLGVDNSKANKDSSTVSVEVDIEFSDSFPPPQPQATHRVQVSS